MNKRVLKEFMSLAKEMEKGSIPISDEFGFFTTNQPIKLYCEIQDEKYRFSNVKDNFTPVLKINDLEKFIDLLNELSYIKNNFHEGMPPFLNIESTNKFIIYTTFLNMTEKDLENPIKYLEGEIKAYENPLFKHTYKDLGVINIDNEECLLSLRMLEAGANVETPYVYILSLNNSYQTYIFPTIYANKVDDRLIIRGIQSSGHNFGSFAEKIDLYIKTSLPKTSHKQLRNITPNFAFALKVFIDAVLEEPCNEINYISFPIFAPLNYHVHREIFKLRNLDENVSLKEKEKIADEKSYKMQNRVTNKFLYTALRVADHCPEFEIYDYGEIDSYLTFKVNLDKKKDIELYQIKPLSKEKRI